MVKLNDAEISIIAGWYCIAAGESGSGIGNSDDEGGVHAREVLDLILKLGIKLNELDEYELEKMGIITNESTRI